MKKILVLFLMIAFTNLYACFETVDVELKNNLEISKFTINHRINFIGTKNSLVIKQITNEQREIVAKSFIIGTDKLLRIDADTLKDGAYNLLLNDGLKDYFVKIDVIHATKTRTKTRGGGCAGELSIKVIPTK